MTFWAYHGTLCFVKPEEDTDYIPLFRYWDGNHHFYTVSQSDYDSLDSSIRKDGIICYVSSEEKRGYDPLHLFENSSTGEQILWCEEETKDMLVTEGYTFKKTLGFVGKTDAYKRIPLYYCYNPDLSDSFYTTKVEEIDEKAPFKTIEDLFSIIDKQLAGLTINDCRFFPSDTKYFCPTIEAVEEIIESAMINHYDYISEKFDCDEFVTLMKTAFILDAYENGKRTMPYCCGIAYGTKPKKHAINILVISDGAEFKVVYLDPQNGKIVEPSKDILSEIFVIFF